MPTWWTGGRSSALLSEPVNATASATLNPAHLRRMLSSAHVDCQLEENKPVRLRHASGLQLACVEGIAWITFHGQPEDLMLHAGQATVVPNGGLVLMEAIGQTRVRLALESGVMRNRAGNPLGAVMQRLPSLLFRRALPD